MYIKSLAVKNYRTLEHLDVSFESYYTAICGQNNSGKSNLVRIIRYLLSTDRSYPYMDDDEELTYKSDATRWKLKKGPLDPITLSLELEISQEADFGLTQFVDKFGPQPKPDRATGSATSHRLKIDVTRTSTETTNVQLSLDGVRLDPLGSQNVFDKIQSAPSLIFHDSTATRGYYPYRHNFHGHVIAVHDTEKKKLHEKQKNLTNAMRRIMEGQRQEFAQLIGRLGERYDVTLSIPELDLRPIPFAIALGDKDYTIPLDEWGSGTKNQTLVLQRMFDAAKAASSPAAASRITPVLLIEEPESFLHPLAQAKFGRVLQDLADELRIQLIVTTHSPYLLSHKTAGANLLLHRPSFRNKLRATETINTDGPDWKKPFEHALGICGPEFDLFKEAIFADGQALLLVEGDTDKEYLEMLRHEAHGSNRLRFTGEFHSYGGCGNLQNGVLLKFVAERFPTVLLSCDLDVAKQMESVVKRMGLKKDCDYFTVGLDEPGKRCIEGLLPDAVINTVLSKNTDLARAQSSNDTEEARDAKRRLKSLYLEEFKRVAKPSNEYYAGFYALAKRINKALDSRSKT